MNKLLIICGPTAVGKTKLGLKMAKKFRGELVSADSRQVYKRMDIGTGKGISSNSKIKTQNSKLQLKNQNYNIGYRLLSSAPVWLVDVCRPDQEFSVAHFTEFATRVITDIQKRRKLPIVVGGSGFWIKTLVEGADSLGIPPDWKLRKLLEKETVEQLGSKLRKLDPERWAAMNQSDSNNPRRIIRAIEITKIKNVKIKMENDNAKLKIDKLLIIGLKTKDYQSLYKKIDGRVDERIRQGAEKEVRSLIKAGYSWDLPSFSASGYRLWQDYFEGKITLPETIQLWKYEEHGLARRQLIYLKKLENVAWFDICRQGVKQQIENLVGRWYSGNSGTN